MAKGEMTFSTSGRKAAVYNFKPLPAGNAWVGRLIAKKCKVQVSNTSGLSRVTAVFEVLDSGEDGGKNKLVFHDFNLGLTPGKDGVAMVDRGASITGFAKGTGNELKGCGVVNVTRADNDKKEQALNAMHVLKWLQGMDGVLVTFASKLEDGTGKYANQQFCRLQSFAETEVSEDEIDDADEEEVDDDEEDDEEADADSDEDDDEDESEDGDEDEADEDDDEEEPVKVLKKKVSSKVVPIGKKKSKK